MYCILTSVSCTSCEKAAVFTQMCEQLKIMKTMSNLKNLNTVPRTLTWSKVLESILTIKAAHRGPSRPWHAGKTMECNHISLKDTLRSGPEKSSEVATKHGKLKIIKI